MQPKLNSACEEWVARARNAILRFWDKRRGHFYRDSAELKRRSAMYFPTATFACVAALERYRWVFGLAKTSAQYSYVDFLNRLRRGGIDQLIATSAVNPPRDSWH